MPVDARDARDWTPLMIAAFHDRDGIARTLIENGADPRAGDRGGYTALHWAALNGHDRVVAVLSRAVDCNLRSTSGFTPLMQASTRGHIAVVNLLLRAGADPNLATRDGWTPLHRAIANRHHAIVRLLIGAGASPFAAMQMARHRCPWRYRGTTMLPSCFGWPEAMRHNARLARAVARFNLPRLRVNRATLDVGACNRSLFTARHDSG